MDRPHFEFGKYLEELRQAKHPNAKEFFEGAKLSFSYRTYTNFERGVTLPDGSQLLEIAQALGEDLEPVFLEWVLIQLPTDDLKTYFANLKTQGDLGPARSEGEVPTTDLDQTWIQNQRDIRLYKLNPWLWDVVEEMIKNYPNTVEVESLVPDQSDLPLLHEQLQLWEDMGYVRSEKGGKVASNYINTYLPNTDQAQAFRNVIFMTQVEKTLNSLSFKDLESGQAHRRIIRGQLPMKDHERLVAKAKQLEEEFRAACLTPAKKKEDVRLAVLFAPARFTKKPKKA